MPREIPYIDTTVAVEKTLAEIEDLLRVHNASHVMKEYDTGRIKAVGSPRLGLESHERDGSIGAWLRLCGLFLLFSFKSYLDGGMNLGRASK